MKQVSFILMWLLSPALFANETYKLECRDNSVLFTLEAKWPINPNLPDAGKGSLKTSLQSAQMSCNVGPTEQPPELPHLIWECAENFADPDTLKTVVYSKGFSNEQKTWAVVMKAEKSLSADVPCVRKQ